MTLEALDRILGLQADNIAYHDECSKLEKDNFNLNKRIRELEGMLANSVPYKVLNENITWYDLEENGEVVGESFFLAVNHDEEFLDKLMEVRDGKTIFTCSNI